MAKKYQITRTEKLFDKFHVGQKAHQVFLPYINVHLNDLSDPTKPVGVFLLTGPTGSGKTLAAQLLAEGLHGSRDRMIRIDCGEYTQSQEVARLIGAPPGYLGHRETRPVLAADKIRAATSEECNITIVLLDEIEKSHHQFHEILLGVLSTGKITLGDGSVADLSKCVFFMTSNLGAKELSDALDTPYGLTPLGAGSEGKSVESICSGAIKRKFSPEFMGRIDEIIHFSRLKKEHMAAIVDIEIDAIRERLCSVNGSILQVNQDVKDKLIRDGFTPVYGARGLSRAIKKTILTGLADIIEDSPEHPLIVVSMDGDEIKIGAVKSKWSLR